MERGEDSSAAGQAQNVVVKRFDSALLVCFGCKIVDKRYHESVYSVLLVLVERKYVQSSCEARMFTGLVVLGSSRKMN